MVYSQTHWDNVIYLQGIQCFTCERPPYQKEQGCLLKMKKASTQVLVKNKIYMRRPSH